MYNEIEELQKSMTRKPAAQIPIEPAGIDVEGDLAFKGGQPQATSKPALSYAQEKKIFDFPSLNAPKQGVYPAQYGGGSAEKIVGGKDADYSGYDDFLNKLNGLKPRDTSTADLINMGISTGIGALFGRVGTAAKIAGDYGVDRANKAEKRGDELENLILKLQADKAAKMATAKKGTKLKGGGAMDIGKPYQNKYVDPSTGLEYTPTTIDPQTGLYIQNPAIDTPTKLPTIKTIDQKNYDGSTTQLMAAGNSAKNIGFQNAQATMTKNAKGEVVPVNSRTVLDNGLPQDFNKTDIGTSPTAKKVYDEVSAQVSRDGALSRYQQAASDLRAASAAIGSDGELSPGFILAAQRFLGMGMDKGRSLTNDEFAKVEGVNSGMVDALRNKLIGYSQGNVKSNEVREEYRKLVALLSTNVEQLRNERIGDFNRQLKQRMGSEYRDDLALPTVGGVTRSIQKKDVDKVNKLSDSLVSDKFIVKEYQKKNPDGSVMKRKVKWGYNPETKAYDRNLGDL